MYSVLYTMSLSVVCSSLRYECLLAVVGCCVRFVHRFPYIFDTVNIFGRMAFPINICIWNGCSHFESYTLTWYGFTQAHLCTRMAFTYSARVMRTANEKKAIDLNDWNHNIMIISNDWTRNTWKLSQIKCTEFSVYIGVK